MDPNHPTDGGSHASRSSDQESTGVPNDGSNSISESPTRRDEVLRTLEPSGRVEEQPRDRPFDDDSDSMSEGSFSEESDSDDCPLDMRLQKPNLYFQELDTLEAAVLNNSTFQFYTDGTMYKPFTGHSHLRMGHAGNPKVRRLAKEDVARFHGEVLDAANEIAGSTTSASEHYATNASLDRAIQNLCHFIECRNIILWVMESLETMERASYCGSIISILIIDKPGHTVARLVPIQCSKIRELATTFEISLEQLLGHDRLTSLVDTEATFANSVSEACRDFLHELQVNLPANTYCTGIWRCVVHILDAAILSYAGAHTQFIGYSEVPIRYFTLPGPFLEKQYFMFRRRSFSCLEKFLDGKQAWVLEWYSADAPQINLPPLYLSTDATTFGDIWGPMWKTCALQNGEVDHDQILRYSVGNGAIIPWKLPDDNIQSPFGDGKNNVFCHWMSDLDIEKSDHLAGSTRGFLQADDILLIGARLRLQYNPSCNISTASSVQSLRESGSLSELGTMKNSRVVDSNTVQIQVGPPYVKGGAQWTYKRRGCTWKAAWTEDWKNNPQSRNVRILEHRFGVEVSACTFNARRRRLITLLGSSAMVNYLRYGSLAWKHNDCRKEFFTALTSDDHRAFRRLYTSHPDWQPDLGNAITLCIDVLKETGTKENELDLLWVPDSAPGRRVSIRLREHRWIGFLKDNENTCTMAILEDKSLELPDLPEVRACRHQQQGSSNSSTSPSHEDIPGASVLDTAFTLNPNAIPTELRPVPCHGPSGRDSARGHGWSTSFLEAGRRFNFGENGVLYSVRALRNSQILSSWSSSSNIISGIQRLLISRGKHQEYIREERGIAGPINVLILGSKSASDHTMIATATLTSHREYTWPTWVQASQSHPRTVSGTEELTLTDPEATVEPRDITNHVGSMNIANGDLLRDGNRGNEGGGGGGGSGEMT